MDRYICIHGHFYQPPRENPWLEEVELQENAYPYHDWNERITAECYAPNAASRILDTSEKIIDIVNIYSKISFDFGPTLLSWLERHKPEVYQAILDGDRMSMEKFSGHGSALAHAYNHIIMPLANRRDKYTQVVWGIEDFQKRFQRFPEGMWLPETAADIETLEVMADLGIQFTLLSPRQAKGIREIGRSKKWKDVSGEKVDPTMAYLCVLPSGRMINLFFYDGPISQDVSFGGLLKSGEAFAKRLESAFQIQRDRNQLVHIATDGETFGHHHRYGDMALSYCLHYVESNDLARLTNYGEYLKKTPPALEIEILENSSWSCVHGIERWRDNCGCSTGTNPEWNQEWRKPLRSALDWLRNKLILVYEEEASRFFRNPWEVRNGYIKVVFDRSRKNVEHFLGNSASRKLSRDEKITALKLLEIQRNAMLMYTSCGWFFNEISGIEGIQIMRYAARAVQYAEEIRGKGIAREFLKQLTNIPSNVFKNAEEPYRKFVVTAESDLLRVGAHYCISSLFEKYPDDIRIFCYSAKSIDYDRTEGGKQTLAFGKATVISDITLDEKPIYFAVLHLGDHNINAGVKELVGDTEFTEMKADMKAGFDKGDIPGVIRLIDMYFDGNTYSLWHLFKDEQRKILDQILELTYENIENAYRHIYEDNYQIISFFHHLNIQLPSRFSAAMEYIVALDLRKEFEAEEVDTERLKKLIEEAEQWDIAIDSQTMSYVVSKWLRAAVERLDKNPESADLLVNIGDTLEALKPLALSPDLWNAQNIYFSLGKNIYSDMHEKSLSGDRFSKKWIAAFHKLGSYLHVKVSG
jgi:alpha-amylase/alpha-mannosidase (GH57 family)